MMRHLGASFLAFTLLAAGGCSPPAQPMPQGPKPLRVGAASSPKYGAVFDAMKRDFERQGQPFEFTLYMNYHKLVEALLKHEVDIAWNTPMAHARAMALTGGKVVGPIARDVDIQYAAQVVVRKDSGINTLSDLVGKRMALGTVESAELQALPKYFLKKEGLDLDTQTTIINLDGLVDDQMNALSTATHVLAAVTEGRAEAGTVGEKTTRAIRNDPNSLLKVIWTSPRYTHCIMTALVDANPVLLNKFKQVLLSETMEDPIGKEVLVNEGNDLVWMDSDNERDSILGFNDLLASITEQSLPLTDATAATIRIGAVSSTKTLLAFEAMRRYFLREGETGFEFVLFGTQDQVVNAMFDKRIDIAWNAPLYHAKTMLRSQNKALAPIARTTDADYHFQVVVRKDSGLTALTDLVGKRLVTGSEQSAELSILPRHLLPSAGLDLAKVTTVSLNGRIDAERRLVDDEASVAAAVIAGEGDAGVVGDALAATIVADPASPLRVIFTSPGFGYRTMTALPDYSPSLLNRFTSLMTSMNMTDPTAKTVLENENGTAWTAGSNGGYQTLIDAINKQHISVR